MNRIAMTSIMVVLAISLVLLAGCTGTQKSEIVTVAHTDTVRVTDTLLAVRNNPLPLDVNSREIFTISGALKFKADVTNYEVGRREPGEVLFLTMGQISRAESTQVTYFEIHGTSSDTLHDAFLLKVNKTNAPYTTARVTQECWGEGEGSICHWILEINVAEAEKTRYASLF